MNLNKKKIEIIGFSIILLCLIVLVYLAFQIKTDGAKCIANPLVYGANELSEKAGWDFIGEGRFLVAGTPYIYFDRYNLTIKRQYSISKYNDYQGLNFSYKE